ncbi:MipA/OmpV family protein [Phenylobacterium sp.]|uniref:MipA/OmpV family protein n=1 Tax=Phenylobacterium sp. TaxID=1871053 RepID=UPI001200AC0E|nr:MipA/OmpV family protein [Phenylobacterium sp.]THD58982.1 MAG: MipA/OmpV family protein [Phenylobacterium sp.]
MRRLVFLGSAVVGGLALLQASAAAAQQAAAPEDNMTLFGWAVAGRVQAQVAPDYMGAKTYSVGPSGSLQFFRPGTEPVFSAPDDSPSLQVLGDRTLSAGLVARYRSGRGDDDALRGFDKIDWAIEPGIYAEWWPMDGIRLHAEARRGVHGNEAWMGDLAADAVHDDPRWLLSIGPRLHLAESKFTETYFGVTPADAARSPFGISPYSADGTFTSGGALASVEYRWTRRWSILADADYERLFGKAGDSPIVARLGSRDQITAALGLRYAFGR